LARADQALADAQSTAHVPTFMQLHFWRWFLGAIRLNADSAAADAEAASALVSQHDIRTFSGYTTFARGWVSWSRGERISGMAEMLSGMSLSRDQEYRLALPFYETLVAKAEAEAGEVDAALTRLNRAFAEVEQTGERWHEAEMYRIRGEILLERDAADTALAEDAFRTAIAIARQQQAKSWELRAATSLARIWRDQGKRNEARELLAPVYGWFTEGFDTLDLKEAKALLDGSKTAPILLWRMSPEMADIVAKVFWGC
jgi:predicted ATPase